MPLYKYRCEGCGEEFEEIRSFTESDRAGCPRCGKSARKLVSRFARGGDGTSTPGFCGPGLKGE